MPSRHDLFSHVHAVLGQHGGMSAIPRRQFLKGALAIAAGNIAAALPLREAAAQAASNVRFTSYPFTLGVASGSPRATGVVLWTRLAPEPLAQSGDGGMPPDRVMLQWEVAHDESFKRIAAKGTIRTVSELAHSAHVEVEGLEPGRWYWYRFMAGNEVSPVGRTRTAEVPGTKMDRFRLAFASCQQFEHGYFSAYQHMARENIDLVAFLGDYIYEANWGSNPVRRHAGPECETLAQYRVRHGQYKTDRDLQGMHQQAPWIVTWDDHEVDNDYAGDQSEHLDPRFLLRRAAAYQAFYEHMPLARSALPRGPNMRLYDRFSFGDLADFHVLDDRQYRTPQACPRPGMGGSAFVENCTAHRDPAMSLLGDVQEQWLMQGLQNSRATWNVLTQQTMMAQWDFKPGPGQRIWTDAWDGYPASRAKLTRFLAERKINNSLVIGGDIHTNAVGNVKVDFDDPASPVVASEICGTSISSQGNSQAELDAALPDNPHILLADTRYRGYVVMELGPQRATAALRVIDSEKTRTSTVSTQANFTVQAGRPGVQRA